MPFISWALISSFGMDSSGEADFLYLLSMWSGRLSKGRLASWSVPKTNKCQWGGLKYNKLLLVHQGASAVSGCSLGGQ